MQELSGVKNYTATLAGRKLGMVLAQAIRDGGVHVITRKQTLLVRVRVVEPTRAQLAALKASIPKGRGKASRTTVAFLRNAQREVDNLPEELRVALLAYAKRPAEIRVNEFARRAGMTRRSLDRKVVVAGFVGVAPLLKAIAVAGVWDTMVRDMRAGLRLAHQLDYRTRVIRRHIKAFLGVRATVAVTRFTSQQVARRLAAQVTW